MLHFLVKMDEYKKKLNPQLSFWQVLNKYCVFWLFYIDLLLQCCLWWHHCDYAWVASCTFGQLCGLLSSFVDSLSMRKHLYNSSVLYFLKHSELRHNASAHMKMLLLEYFFLNETESFHKYKKKEPRTIWLKCEESSYQYEYWVAFFLFQKRIFINFECINMRELFGIARMQTNLNKLKGQTGGKWDAACLNFW